MKIAKLISVILIIIIVIFLSFKLFYKKEPLISFTENNTTIYLEIANTEKQRELGLMFRKSLPMNHGMIFLFNQPQRLSFWMKNTFIPLDMIFLNKSHVVAILTNIPPCKKTNCPSYSPNIIADEVIELNAGRTKKLGIAVDDNINLH